jgi:AMMECR1 domain-containing protein
MTEAYRHVPRRLVWISAVLLMGILLATAVPARELDERALIELARAAMEAEVEGQDLPRIDRESPAQPVFVTIESKGRILGCRGGLECRTRSLEQEILLAARAAARHDPRYAPIVPKDLADLQVTITVVESMTPLDRIESLTPADGLVLKAGGRTGVVLPWEGKDPTLRLTWAYKKAGVPRDAACQLYRLKAERFRG